MTANPPLDKRISLLWANPERAAELAAIHAELFSPPWDANAIRSLLDHPAATALVAVVGKPQRVIGFVIGQLAADEAEVHSIGVVADCQRLGIGTHLLEGLKRAAKRAEARSLFLEVAADNEPALALYRRIGMREIGRRKDYYVRPGLTSVDAIRLALDL